MFERNVLQGGYRDVNRGSGSRTGWNSIIGRFVISKLTNSIRKMKEEMRYDDATNKHVREKCRNFGMYYKKKNFIRNISSQTE